MIVACWRFIMCSNLLHTQSELWLREIFHTYQRWYIFTRAFARYTGRFVGGGHVCLRDAVVHLCACCCQRRSLCSCASGQHSRWEGVRMFACVRWVIWPLHTSEHIRPHVMYKTHWQRGDQVQSSVVATGVWINIVGSAQYSTCKLVEQY